MTTTTKENSKTVEQTNINTCRVSELKKQNLNKIVSKFIAKLKKYRILFKEILTFLEHGMILPCCNWNH